MGVGKNRLGAGSKCHLLIERENLWPNNNNL